jgi:Ala-tRNA(Pro) deacylase
MPAPITDEPALLAALAAHAIPYTRITHPPVYTCAEAAQYRPPVPGVDTKNLFLRDEKQHFYLVMTACEKRLDLKALGKALGGEKLHFGSEAQLFEALGLTPGAVTVLALINDPAWRVQLLVDADYWPADAYLCHPMVNTATLVLDYASLLRFFALTGHAPQVVQIPARA